MRVAIVGTRCEPTTYLRAAVVALCRSLPAGTFVVSGGAIGVDTLAKYAALGCGLGYVEHRVTSEDWRRLGKYAGIARNKALAEDCDELHAFWDGESRGTKSAINFARKAGKVVTIHPLASATPPEGGRT